MEASDGVIRGNVDSLTKLIGALDAAGIELIGEGAASQPAAAASGSRAAMNRPRARRSVRRSRALPVAGAHPVSTAFVLVGVAALLADGAPRRRRVGAAASRLVYARPACVSAALLVIALMRLIGGPGATDALDLPLGLAVDRRAFPRRRARRPSSSPSSISAVPARASTGSATAATKPRRSACSPSSRPFSPA